jgi:hypothetical protein
MKKFERDFSLRIKILQLLVAQLTLVFSLMFGPYTAVPNIRLELSKYLMNNELKPFLHLLKSET